MLSPSELIGCQRLCVCCLAHLALCHLLLCCRTSTTWLMCTWMPCCTPSVSTTSAPSSRWAATTFGSVVSFAGLTNTLYSLENHKDLLVVKQNTLQMERAVCAVQDGSHLSAMTCRAVDHERGLPDKHCTPPLRHYPCCVQLHQVCMEAHHSIMSLNAWKLPCIQAHR